VSDDLSAVSAIEAADRANKQHIKYIFIV
jgi:hypothetical protein